MSAAIVAAAAGAFGVLVSAVAIALGGSRRWWVWLGFLSSYAITVWAILLAKGAAS